MIHDRVVEQIELHIWFLSVLKIIKQGKWKRCVSNFLFPKNSWFGSHLTLMESVYKIEIKFAKLDLCIEYPLAYKRFVWNYKQADSIFVQHAINEFNREKSLSNMTIN